MFVLIKYLYINNIALAKEQILVNNEYLIIFNETCLIPYKLSNVRTIKE